MIRAWAGLVSSGRKTTAPGWLAWVIMRCKYVGEWYSRRGHFVPVNELMSIFEQYEKHGSTFTTWENTHSVGYMKRNQIYSFEALHDVMAVYDREFGISFPRIRPKLESWDLRKSHDNKIVDQGTRPSETKVLTEICDALLSDNTGECWNALI